MKKILFSVGAVALVAILGFCVIVLPSLVKTRQEYAILQSYVAKYIPVAAKYHGVMGSTDCYGSGKSSCLAITYRINTDQCRQAARTSDCSTREVAYEGHTIRVTADADSLVVWLADDGVK
jgi:hypothetical protein